MTSLRATPEEQHAALAAAGFEHVQTRMSLHGVDVCSGTRPPSGR